MEGIKHIGNVNNKLSMRAYYPLKQIQIKVNQHSSLSSACNEYKNTQTHQNLEEQLKQKDQLISELQSQNQLLKLKLYNWELYPKQKEWQKNQELMALKTRLQEMEKKTIQLQDNLNNHQTNSLEKNAGSQKSLESNTLEKALMDVNQLESQQMGSKTVLKADTNKIIEIFDRRCQQDHQKLVNIKIDFNRLLSATIMELQCAEKQIEFDEGEDLEELTPMIQKIFLNCVELKAKIEGISGERN